MPGKAPHIFQCDAAELKVKVACAGRFHTFPLIAFWQMLNAGVALIRKGHHQV